jgi:hypothetical protein
MSLFMLQLSTSTKQSLRTHPPYSPNLIFLWFYFLFLRMKLKLKRRHFESTDKIQDGSQDVWRCWRKMTSISASNHWNPTGITVLM